MAEPILPILFTRAILYRAAGRPRRPRRLGGHDGALVTGRNLTSSLRSKPIVGMAVGPGRGYYLVASGGGLFSFGAPFFGSLGVRPTLLRSSAWPGKSPSVTGSALASVMNSPV